MDSNDNEVPKRRGPKGRRPVVWVCSAIKDGELIVEKFSVKDQDPGNSEKGSFPRSIAEKAFFDKHEVEAKIVLGPLFEKKGAVAASKKRRLDIDRENLDQYQIGVQRRNAIFGDWKGFSNEIKDNPDLSFFIFLQEVNPSGRKKIAPTPGIVKISDVTFLDEEPESQTETASN